MKIVKFENGLYGIRRYWLLAWHYLDLTDTRYTHMPNTPLFQNCMGDLEQVKKCIVFLLENIKLLIYKTLIFIDLLIKFKNKI